MSTRTADQLRDATLSAAATIKSFGESQTTLAARAMLSEMLQAYMQQMVDEKSVEKLLRLQHFARQTSALLEVFNGVDGTDPILQ